MWLSYSQLSQYKTCPKQYDYDRVSETEPPVRESRHNAIIGTVVQRVFEDFYNDEIWRRESGVLEELQDRGDQYFQEFLDNNYVNFDDVTCRFDGPSEVLSEIREIIPKSIKGIQRETLIGPYAQSELEIKTSLGSDQLIGYLDFVIRQAAPSDEPGGSGTLMILDGKTSRHREEYVEEDQLHFYALLFCLRYHKLPDKMGFFYYRFADDPEQAIQWVPVEKEEVFRMKQEAKRVIGEVKSREFEARPKYSHCQWCQWEEICEERQQQIQENRQERGHDESEILDSMDDDETSQSIGF